MKAPGKPAAKKAKVGNLFGSDDEDSDKPVPMKKASPPKKASVSKPLPAKPAIKAKKSMFGGDSSDEEGMSFENRAKEASSATAKTKDLYALA